MNSRSINSLDDGIRTCPLPQLSCRCGHTHRHGTTAVEFALLLPLLILMVLGTCDFGRVSHFHQIVANAARSGAEAGARRRFTEFTRPLWEARVHQTIRNEMTSIPGFDESDMNTTLTTQEDEDGMREVSVTVSYPFRSVINWPGLPNEIMMNERIEFRQFR